VSGIVSVASKGRIGPEVGLGREACAGVTQPVGQRTNDVPKIG
jgi:hypothetical protein